MKTNAHAEEPYTDHGDFTQIYNKYIDKVYGFAYYLVYDKELAQDIAADTMLKVYQKLHTFDGTSIQLKSWIFTIARNVAFNMLRKQKKLIRMEIAEFDGLISAVEPTTQTEIELIDMWQKVNQLPQKYKEVLLLKFKYEFENKEIAEIIKISESNVRQLISRAKKLIKQTYEQENKLT